MGEGRMVVRLGRGPRRRGKAATSSSEGIRSGNKGTMEICGEGKVQYGSELCAHLSKAIVWLNCHDLEHDGRYLQTRCAEGGGTTTKLGIGEGREVAGKSRRAPKIYL